MDTVYLDNAATSFPKPAGMSARMKDYMDNIGATINRSVYASLRSASGNGRSGFSTSMKRLRTSLSPPAQRRGLIS